MPLKKPDDAGYPKCPGCVFAGVPANAPLLKVYDYGPLGARFFALYLHGISGDQSVCVTRSEVREESARWLLILALMVTSSSGNSIPIPACRLPLALSGLIHATRRPAGSFSRSSIGVSNRKTSSPSRYGLVVGANRPPFWRKDIISSAENAFALNRQCQNRLLIGISHAFTLTGHTFPAKVR